MRRDSRILVLLMLPLFAAAILLVGTGAAHADYRFCNATSYVLEGAIGIHLDETPIEPANPAAKENAPADKDTATLAGGGKWQSKGWTRILPGKCRTIIAGALTKGDYYVFARSISAHQGPTKYFSGNARFCTLPETFEITGRENCATRGYNAHDFIRVAVKSTSEWTTTFREPRDYSLKKAQIAGAQRLLKDNGLRLPKIDGYAAKNTRRAVEAFQRTKNIAVTGTIDDGLIEELIKGAMKEQARSGLNLCNKTPYLVWAAIGVGMDKDDDEISSGWIRVPPKACTKAIKDKLDPKTAYYVYAEATDKKGGPVWRGNKRLSWKGKEPFCTKTTRFEIRGRDACAARGYDERAFMRIKTDGKPLYNLSLE